jgi:hypothetical protein
MLVRIRPLKWIKSHPASYSTKYGPMGYGSVLWFEEGERVRFQNGQWGHYPAGWYYQCSWDHGDCELEYPTPCDSLEHGKACVEASYLAHMKPMFDFVEGDE